VYIPRLRPSIVPASFVTPVIAAVSLYHGKVMVDRLSVKFFQRGQQLAARNLRTFPAPHIVLTLYTVLNNAVWLAATFLTRCLATQLFDLAQDMFKRRVRFKCLVFLCF